MNESGPVIWVPYFTCVYCTMPITMTQYSSRERVNVSLTLSGMALI